MESYYEQKQTDQDIVFKLMERKNAQSETSSKSFNKEKFIASVVI